MDLKESIGIQLNGEPRLTLEDDLETARQELVALADLGISMDQVTQELEEEGVAAFAASFEKMMTSIARQLEAV